MKVAFLSVNTGAYDTFFKVLFPYNYQNFLPDCQVTFFVFTDSKDLEQSFALNPRVKVIYQEYEPWPAPTLDRFAYFLSQAEQLQEFDYIFFANANYYCKNPIKAEQILFAPTGDLGKDLIMVEHFGQNFIAEHLRSYERNPSSQAYIAPQPERPTTYVAGGFYGGTAQAFLALARTLAQRIQADKEQGIVAHWHDESHLNRYLYDLNYACHFLPPCYCVPQEYDFESRYIGERQDWPCVLLNKNALPSPAQDIRSNQASYDPRWIEILIMQERELESWWLRDRHIFYPNAIKNQCFNTLLWEI
ncbi:hypothetical protein CJP74_03515 [Psittacicella melopsittaci]|uniref:Glycosyltransferase family 6 n=1 Tax=Psittacicella melopsittaci TaxID=2028576 RepID=A0A3A1Y6E1_9GAMM|nr:hypothetical protein [Psittacicella melopsittaci]RIY32778.1 hypothetical protein CJP74_03515 [Psittacicella melopsittaci]